jgi:CMP-N-acetylneuraminic acid synthetase
MRHYSERVPGKNYRSFAGKPLFHHIVSNLLACPLLSEVIIDTDSPAVMEGVSENFPEVRIIQRPEHLRADTTSMNEVLLHDIKQSEADFYLQTHSTNPLLRSETIQKSVRLFIDNFPAHDSLFGVTRIQARLWDGLANPVNHNPAILLRTQDLPPIYMENSCLYIFTAETLINRRNRIGERPFMFEIDPIEAQDIDVESDFTLAEVLYKEQEGRS